MTEELISLIEQAKSGSQKAFSELYYRYKSNIWFIIMNIVKNTDVADDLTSVVFTKAYEKLSTYVDHISFEMWLKTIAVNSAIDYIRRTKKEQLNNYVDSEENTIQLSDTCQSPEIDMIMKEKLAIVLKTSPTLKQKYQDIIKLRLEGLSYKEIADKLAMDESKVKSDLNKARQKLKKLTNY